ncbi:MAG: vWA domain-containing protein, partial [candidate division WOR-3 bacterium]
MIGIFSSLILLVLAILVYRKDLKTKDHRWLFILRILVIIFLSLILIGNIIAFTFTKSSSVPLLFLIDVSPSMSEKISQAKDFLIQFKPKTKTQYFAFADSVIGPKSIENLVIQGSKTDIAQALNIAKKKSPGAVVLLSDGQHNALSDPVKTATDLPFPVYTLGLGKTAEHDVAIRTVRVPKQIYSGETTDCVVRIQSQGLGNRKAKISLWQGSKELQQRE